MNQKTTMNNPGANRATAGSFHKKSAGISMVVVASIAIYYLLKLFAMIQTSAPLTLSVQMPEGYWQLAIATLVLIIVVEIVLQTVLAIGAGAVPTPTEREQISSLKARRNAYTVLVVGVVATFATLFSAPSPFMMGNLLLIFFVLAEITKYASKLIYA